MRRFRVIEDATLPDFFTNRPEIVAEAGQIVYEFLGATYGCISPNGLACSATAGEGPFFEVALSNLVRLDEEEK